MLHGVTNLHKKFLVSGGLGFIGSEVASRLHRLGHDIIVVDSLTTNVIQPDEFRALNPRAIVIKGDIVDFIKDDRAGLASFDFFFHAAAVVGSVEVTRHLGTLAHEILHSTQVVAEACLEHKLDLIAISSSEVYGRSGVLDELSRLEINPDYNARIEYAIGKIAGECAVQNLRHKGLRAMTLRPFNIVGPRQNAITGFVLPNFVQQALRGEPLTVYYDGSQERSFTSVYDISDFIVRHATAPGGLAADAIGSVVNIGTINNRSNIVNLAKLVNEVVGNDAGFRLHDPKSIHGTHFFESESTIKLPDDSKARNLGWHPKYSLRDIVEDVVNHYELDNKRALA